MTSSRLLYIDIETYSDIELTECGVYKYAESPNFEVQLLGYAYDDEEPKVVDLLQGEKIPAKVLEDLTAEDVIKIAHNANFERTCLTKWLGVYMEPSQWFCTAVRATSLGLPRSLKDIGNAIGLSEDEKKQSIGKLLIRVFAKPTTPSRANGYRTKTLPIHEPEKWELYKEYNRQDVVTERAIHKRLEAYPATTEQEHKLWELDQKINEGGVLVNETMVDNIIEYNAQHENELKARAIEITGLQNPQSIVQLRKWLASKGVQVATLDKEVVRGLLDTELDPEVREVLRIRQELGKTSVTKYQAMARAMCEDKRIRGMLQFYGASRTGRWAGRIVQLQNLPQNHLRELDKIRQMVVDDEMEAIECLYESPNDIFSQLVRTALTASKDKCFVVCDYSAIEARVIAWLSGEEWVLDVFRGHGKIYEATASQMFGVPIESIGKGSEHRKKGKVATLACGFGGGVGALARMDSRRDIPENERQSIIDKWRKANPNIVKLWADTERVAKDAVLHPGLYITVNDKIGFQFLEDTLFVKLASGRCLAYAGARVQKQGNKTTLYYMGQNQTTQKWEEVDTYGGKLVENITQATARDCLGAAMLRLEKRGYKPQFHVHDEVIVECEKSHAESELQAIKDIMALEDLEWCQGLPLRAEGYLCDYYQKD